MKTNSRIAVSLAVIAALSACGATPKRIESLEMARTVVPQVETSERAGVAALNVSNARKSLNAANSLAESGGKLADIEFQAQNALTSAQIANEKILTAQAQEQVESGNAKRQAVQLEARGREIQKSAQAASDATQQANASTLRADSLADELADLKAKRTERGLVLTLGDVLFDTSQATLRSGAYGTLDRLASALKDKPGRKVLIEGHTDNVGSDANNQALSERRAQSVQMALMQRGVSSNQITVLGKGEGSPLASNEDAGSRQQNRRVELIFSEDSLRIAADGS